MQWLCAKLWEYSDLPRPYSYPLKGRGKKLTELSWKDFLEIPEAHWRKLLIDLNNINTQRLIIDFAGNKVRYDVRRGFIFLACYAAEPALSWENERLFFEVLKTLQETAVRYERTLNTPPEKRYFYRKMESFLFSIYSEILFGFAIENSETIKHKQKNIIKLLGIYREKLEKTKYSVTDDPNSTYTLSGLIGIHL
ncbi:MAG: hypothetical protein LBD62_04135 [Candidatus Margulisbacteria bacterium]|jgi:hypothetical protein|nr:hypothetical protein [Candidatus Margulisiibacteriota bacterium]